MKRVLILLAFCAFGATALVAQQHGADVDKMQGGGSLPARDRDRLVIGVGVAAQDRAGPRILGGEDGACHQRFIPDGDLV